MNASGFPAGGDVLETGRPNRVLALRAISALYTPPLAVLLDLLTLDRCLAELSVICSFADTRIRLGRLNPGGTVGELAVTARLDGACDVLRALEGHSTGSSTCRLSHEARVAEVFARTTAACAFFGPSWRTRAQSERMHNQRKGVVL